jgi:hypothetical protein
LNIANEGGGSLRKLVIWGNGLRGKWTYDIIGRERIAYYIDENRNKQNTFYNGIEVISKYKYLSEYSNYPILVTPSGHVKNIIKELYQDDIYWCYDFDEEFYSIKTILKQLSIDKLLCNYKKNQQFAIWGHGIFARILYDLFEEKGFDIKIIIDESVNEQIYEHMKNISRISLVRLKDCMNEKRLILLGQKINDSVKMCLQDNEVIDYFNLQFNLELFRNQEIEKFKKIHSGKRCFIIGTGPSLRMSDLDILHDNNEICFAVNSIFPAFNKTKWRPTYYISSDVIDTWKNEILKLKEVNSDSFISDYAWCFDENDDTSNIFKWHTVIQCPDGQQILFSDDFSKGGYCIGSVVYGGGMQLAAYMGFTEIYLLGVDCYYSKEQKYNHFGKNEDPDDKYYGNNADEMISAYEYAKEYSDKHGFKIYNATRGGALEVFPRVDFDTLFS